jgi:hypothetical protein
VQYDIEVYTLLGFSPCIVKFTYHASLQPLINLGLKSRLKSSDPLVYKDKLLPQNMHGNHAHTSVLIF